MASAVVLLTGASGFLGRSILARLVESSDFSLHAVNRQGVGPHADRVTWHAADLLDRQTRVALMEKVQPTHLLHNAWMAVPGRFWSDSSNIAWMQASAHLMSLLATGGGRRFVGVGSCAEYDWSSEVDLYREDATPIYPATLYGKTKAASFATAEAHAAAGDFSVAWGRVFLPYGPGDTEGRLLPTLLRELLADRTMQLGDGTLERDFIHTADAADLLVRLLTSDVQGAFNIGSGRATSLRQVVEYVADRLQKRHLLQFGTRASAVSEPRRLVADMGKVQRTLGWSASIPLTAGLAGSVDAKLQAWLATYDLTKSL